MELVTKFKDTSIINQRTQEQTVLHTLWSEKPTLLLFLRRLGCPICRTYAMQIQESLSEFTTRGIRVVAISFEALGEGSDSDGSFSKGGYWTGELFSVSKEVYQDVFGKKSIFGVFNIDPNALQQMRKRNISGNFKGDGLVLGGQIGILPSQQIVLDHRQSRFGDDATVDTILKAFESISLPSSQTSSQLIAFSESLPAPQD